MTKPESIYNKEWRWRIRRKADEVFGTKCFFCENRKKLTLHNKKGERHPTWLTARLALRNPIEWVRLCHKCHRGVHFCMEAMGMDWEEIETVVRSKR